MNVWTIYNPTSTRLVSLPIPVSHPSSSHLHPSYVRWAVLIFDDKKAAFAFKDRYIHYANSKWECTSKNVESMDPVHMLLRSGPEFDNEGYMLKPLGDFDNDGMIRKCVTSYLSFLYVHSYQPKRGMLSLNGMMINPIREYDHEQATQMVVEHLDNMYY